MNCEIRDRAVTAGSHAWVWPADTPQVLRRVFARRDIAGPQDLQHDLKGLLPVGRFTALAAACDLLDAHRGGRIVIVGDFDADGATSAALLQLGLGALGFQVAVVIPDRFEMGYGLTPSAVTQSLAHDPTLLVTVDNGVTSFEGVELARQQAVDVLITDHHLPGPRLPAANVIVNPNLPDEAFPGPHLAGVGVAFYLLAALARRYGRAAEAAAWLDLVALGTMADVVPLDRNNRILVNEGVRRIRAGRCRPGIRALFAAAGRSLAAARASDLAFYIGPRLNAAGRLEDMAVGVRCLTTDDDREAHALASRLDSLNRERREIEAQMQDEAHAIVEALALERSELPAALCLSGADWHQGVVGLVASRVKDRFHRPVFAFAPAGDGELKGSGRSIPGFHLRDALADIAAAAPDLMSRFGGHAMAAGLTLPSGRLQEFAAALQEAALRRLEPEQLSKAVLTDGELKPAELTLETAHLLRDAAPWGQHFPEPMFRGRFVVLARRIVGERHLKLTLQPASGQGAVDGIAFGAATFTCAPGDELDLVYRLDVNQYRDYPAHVQLLLEHLAPVA